jgi:Skp family chaperone for outer membrane proteins
MQRWKLAGCLAALVAAGVLGAAVPGNAQKPKGKPDSPIGFVDLAQVTDKVKDTAEWKVNVRTFEDSRSKFRNEIENLAKLRFLTPAELEELRNLNAKPKATDGEKERVTQLTTKSSQLDQEYNRLAMTEKPNDTDSKRLKELTTMREQAGTAIQAEYEKRAQQLQKLEGEMLDKMQTKILEVVGQVAEKQNLALVVDRQAVLYGGNDLTQEVLKKLGG